MSHILTLAVFSLKYVIIGILPTALLWWKQDFWTKTCVSVVAFCVSAYTILLAGLFICDEGSPTLYLLILFEIMAASLPWVLGRWRLAIPLALAAVILAGVYSADTLDSYTKPGPGLEGTWMMPENGYEHYALSLTSSGDYKRWFFSDCMDPNEIKEDPKKGKYVFDQGCLTIPYIDNYKDGRSYTYTDKFKRETINGVEALSLGSAKAIWDRYGMIDAYDLLVKVSDDPNYLTNNDTGIKRLFRDNAAKWTFKLTKKFPVTKRLLRMGVVQWTEEAEEAMKQKK